MCKVFAIEPVPYLSITSYYLKWKVQMYRPALFLFLFLFKITVAAQVVQVDFKETGFLFSAAPTFTFLWPSNAAKATLIFLPGGEGRIGLTEDRKNLGGFYGNTLRPLSDSTLTHGFFNVVVFDSPVNLPVGNDYPYSRQSNEHLLRIESVAKYYKDKFGLPVWIMGHSNGAVSITEFYKFLQKNKREDLVSGAVYSSARNGAQFNDQTQLPILFLAHERDGCNKSPPQQSRKVFEQQQLTNHAKLKYILIKGGQEEIQNPCYSGFHMFYGASMEAYTAIDQFFFETMK